MAFVSAGAYAREIDLSLFVETASNTVFAMAHVFNKGPIGTPTLVTNLNRLLDLFGVPIDPTVSASACQGWFAAREYLRQGNKLWINRVESAAVPAQYAGQSLPGGTDQSMVTRTDGVTSIPGTKTLTSAGADFPASGVLVGDVVELVGGADAGFYTITIVATTVLTVCRNWPVGSLTSQTFTVWTSKRESKDDGATSTSSSRTLTSASASFTTQVTAGDYVKVADTSTPADNGMYRVASVDSATQLTVDRDWPRGALTGLTYTVYSNVASAADGATATAGEFSSASAKFNSHKVQAGDILVVADLVTTTNNGHYLITGLKGGSVETILLVNAAAWPGGSTSSLAFSVWRGAVKLQGLTKGTWCKGDYVCARRNAGAPINFNLEVRDSTNNFVLETVYNLSLSTVVAGMTDSSAYFSATAQTNATEPVVGAQMAVSGGLDGITSIVDADFIGNDTLKTGLKAFKNKEQYDANIIACPGQTSQNVQDALIALAEARGDCIAVIDPPDFPTVDTVQEILDFHNGTNIRTTALNSSYGALYWPWGEVYDEYHDLDVWIAPSGSIAAVYTQNDNQQYPWFAPAGFKRGKCKGLTDLRYSPDQDDRDSLNGPGSNVNPVTNFVGYGIHVFGQKTLQRASTALDRVNVRRMLLFAKSAIEKTCRQLVFDPNDEVLWREFKQLVEPVLKHILTNRGIREYKIIADETTTPADVAEQNKMIGKLFIKPTKSSEIIEIQFVLTAQSTNFQELTA